MRTATLISALVLTLLPTVGQGGHYDDYKALTPAEKRLALRYFWQLGDVKKAAEEARKRSEAAFPTMAGQDDPRDAFRHSMWNGFMTSRLGSREAAERWGTAHESDPANPPVRRAMDLSNNEQGRERTWAARGTRRTWWGGSRAALPDDARVESIMRDALRTGGLVEIEALNGVRDPQAGRLVPTSTP